MKGADSVRLMSLIVIGRATVLRAFGPKNTEEIYTDYVDFSTELHPEMKPIYSRTGFEEEFVGWTRLKVFDVVMAAGYESALVPKDLNEEIQFSTFFGASFGDSGDLVAARINSDGHFIVDRVLCSIDEEYSSCVANYNPGLFDGLTGEQLSYSTLTPKKSGMRINPATLKKFISSPN